MIGLYGLGRRREQGLDATWLHAFDLLQASSFRPILALELVVLVILGVSIAVAQAIYVSHFGYAPPALEVTMSASAQTVAPKPLLN